MDRRVLSAIAVGGVIGATARAALVDVISAGPLSWGVLAANVIGSAVLGWTATRLLQTPSAHGARPWLLALSSGFCGSLTTFSTFVVDIAERLRAGSSTSGAGSLVVSVVLGGAAVWLGHRLATQPTTAAGQAA